MCGYFPAVFRVGSFVTLAYKIRGASKLVPQNFRAFFSSLYHHKKSGKQILSPAIETQFDQTLNTRSVSIGCARWKTKQVLIHFYIKIQITEVTGISGGKKGKKRQTASTKFCRFFSTTILLHSPCLFVRMLDSSPLGATLHRYQHAQMSNAKNRLDQDQLCPRFHRIILHCWVCTFKIHHSAAQSAAKISLKYPRHQFRAL
jgi:hypothetical protein